MLSILNRKIDISEHNKKSRYIETKNQSTYRNEKSIIYIKTKDRNIETQNSLIE